MMNRFTVFIGLILSAFVVSNAVAQEITTAEDFLQTAMPAKTITKTFSYDLRDEFIAHTYCDKYIAITNGRKKVISTPKGYRESKVPTEIDIFDSKGKVATLTNEIGSYGIHGFLESENRFYTYVMVENQEIAMGLFEMDGSLVSTITPSMIDNSPNGKYFYTEGSMNGSFGYVMIYDKDGNSKFRIPVTHDFQTEAPSDSQLILLSYKSLSLWDVNTMRKVWESEIPRDNYYAESIFKIFYSVKANIIVVRDFIGLYCFDFQGNFLWSQEGFRGFKRINMTGVSEEDGMVAVSNTIDVNLYDRNGNLLAKLDGDFSQDISIAGNWGHVMDVFPDYMLIRYLARTIEGDKLGRRHVTRIYYHNGNEWVTKVVYGFWYLLDSESEVKTLIGFDSKSNAVSAYSIE